MFPGQIDRAALPAPEGAERTAPPAEHQAACLTCYRFYRRGLSAEGWHLDAAGLAPRGWRSAGGGRDGRVHAGALAEPPCHFCGCATRIWVQLWRHSRGDGDRLHLSVCHECGHVELLEYRSC